MEESRMFEIPVWVDDAQKWLSGLSKRTTCDDIIYAILYNQNRHETDSTDSYAIFERWKGVEKALQGRTKILRVWRNWDSEQANVQFVMRRVDDIVSSGEYLVTKRRYKRWRHRRRHEYCLLQQGGDCQEHCCDCRAQNQDLAGRHGCPSGKGLGFTKHGDALDRDKLRHLQKLIRTVMVQEKKIKTMASRLDETEILIDKYEAKIHFHRTRKKGINYVQRSLLHDSTSTSEDSLDDFICKGNIDLLEEYVEASDRLIEVWESLISKEGTIGNLVSVIKQYGIEPCTALPECDQHCNRERLVDKSKSEPGASEKNWTAPWDVSTSTADQTTDPEVEAVNTEFNRVITLSVIQNITSEQLEREMIKYERRIDEKGRLIASLENELQSTEHRQSVAKPLVESDNIVCLGSRGTDPVRCVLRAADDDKDIGVKATALQGKYTALQGTSPSLETCLLPQIPGTGSSAGKAALTDKEPEEEDERNEIHGSHVNSSLFTVHDSLDTNITSTDDTTETVPPVNETVNHNKATSNCTAYNNFTITNNTNNITNTANTTNNNTSTANTTNTTTTNNNTTISTTSNNNKQSVTHHKGPRIGIIGGAVRTDYSRTKSKRDWLTVSPSTDKNGTQEKVTINSDLSHIDRSTPVLDTDTKTTKDAENERRNQPPNEAAASVNQCQYSFSRQHPCEASQERDLAASSRLAPSLLNNPQLLLAPENTSGVPCAIFKLDKSDDTDSTSDTGIGSMNSEEFNNSPMETLV